MARTQKRTVLVTLTFRVDPELLDLFYQECKIDQITRSEAFRKVFNEYMFNKYFREKSNETTHD